MKQLSFFLKNDRLQICSSVRGLGKIWILIFLFQNCSSSVLAEILERCSEIRFYLSCNYIWAQAFIVKTQLIKFNFYTPLCLNLHPVTKKQKIVNKTLKVAKIVEFIKIFDQYYDKFTFARFFSPHVKLQEGLKFRSKFNYGFTNHGFFSMW